VIPDHVLDHAGLAAVLPEGGGWEALSDWVIVPLRPYQH